MGEAKRKAEAAMRGEEGCGTCQFFRRKGMGQPLGDCRRYPPTSHLVGMGAHPKTGHNVAMSDSFWVAIADTEWCGEWKHRVHASTAPQIDISKMDVTELEGSA